jgi:hypothetical protein
MVHSGHVLEEIDEGLREHVVALQLRVSPEVGRLAEKLSDADFEGPMEVRYPPFLAFDERSIVQVGVADEHVVIEVHRLPPGTQELTGAF